jgi:methylamine dehydrogenase heavy chain
MLAGLAALLPFLAFPALAQDNAPYDTIIGEAASMAMPDEHWFAAIGNDIAYIVDGDEGRIGATLTLSMFSPAIEPHLDGGRIYTYGSYYTRTYYGERTDVVQGFDLTSALPVSEVEIPPKSAGIGHSGMIGLIEGRYIGVWNITPAMSVSIVDTSVDEFVDEISTPGCAGVYPVTAGFLMACGDGRVQYLRLDSAGREVARTRSEPFFAVDEDPVFDYAVPGDEGWLFLSLEGHVYEVSVEGDEVVISEPWSINPPDVEGAVDLNGVPIRADDDWRIGGSQPFAYNAANRLLLTLMHEGGGQETFEDAGTQIWAFDTVLKRRAYVLDLDKDGAGGKTRAIEMTSDDRPLLLIPMQGSEDLAIHDALSSRLLHTMPEMDVRKVQRLH